MRYAIFTMISVCLIGLVMGCGSEDSVVISSASCQPTQTTGTISGTVRESVQKFSIFGAEVTASGQVGSTVRGFTDEQGIYTLCGLLPGTYQVSAKAVGFEPSTGSSSNDLQVQAGIALDGIDLELVLSFQLPPSNVGAVSGRVISARSPNPGIEKVIVEAWVDTQINDNQIISGEMVKQTLTNEKGEFFLTLNIGSYTLAIYKEGFLPNPRLIIAVVIRSESVTSLPNDIVLFPK